MPPLKAGATANTVAFQGGFNYTGKEWIVTNGGNDPAGSSSFNGNKPRRSRQHQRQ